MRGDSDEAVIFAPMNINMSLIHFRKSRQLLVKIFYLSILADNSLFSASRSDIFIFNLSN